MWSSAASLGSEGSSGLGGTVSVTEKYVVFVLLRSEGRELSRRISSLAPLVFKSWCVQAWRGNPR